MTKMIPTLHIVSQNIPQAHYRAIKAVFENGMKIRTQYDRKNKAGDFIDPPSKDAKVLIEIANPFNQPRYPVISFCEIGTYIAEIMGAKDHLVLPFDRLKRELNSGKLEATEWPYSYHQRLFSYPLQDGRTINQVDAALDRLAKDSISRRAICSTAVPEIDCFMKEDAPCLREIQLRCTEDEGDLYLHMDTKWRSRDLFKAWPDNVIALTYLHQHLANELGDKIDRKVKVGSYSDYSSSLHIYGQDINGNRGVGVYIKEGEEKIIERAMSSDKMRDLLVLPRLKELREESTWNFGLEQIAIIEGIINDLESVRTIA